MNKLFDFIPPAAYPVISEYAKILIPAFITYLVTRYSLNNPHKYQIKEKQFELIYLPLYLLTQQYISASHRNTPFDIHTYIKKVEKLIYKNYPYVYPKTLKLFDSLKTEATNSHMNPYIIMNFEYQATTDYIKLKKDLNYPCDSAISLLKRLNRLDKLLFLASLIMFLVCIIFIASLIISLFNNKFLDAFIYLICIIVSSFTLYLFRCIKDCR